ncbi:hypothetical protein USB125703_01097 [Pseudoclavibacter triregionum]|nr:hypothetical protein USB125703_01097 [Pseudoclavibacter triregionum]
MGWSVCAITACRDEHLLAQIAGVEASVPPPLEHVVVFMGQEDRPWAERPRLVRDVLLPGPVDLARARNRAVAEARGEVAVLLDVDCIPAPETVASLAEEAAETGAVVMAEPRYLAPDWDRASDPALHAIPHPARAELGVGESERVEMFWSLGFAVRKDVFDRIGGFDEGYRGYGAEDTDFAFAAREADVPIRFSAAPVFHQAHAVVKPPLQHAAALVRNANRFAERWGRLPMEGWLAGLERLGLVAVEGERATLLREPSEAEIAARTLPLARF